MLRFTVKLFNVNLQKHKIGLYMPPKIRDIIRQIEQDGWYLVAPLGVTVSSSIR